MLFDRHAAADLQGFALPSRTTPTTASPGVFWRLRWHFQNWEALQNAGREDRRSQLGKDT